MDVLDVSTQILNGGIGTLAEVPVGMVHIPQSPQPVAGEALQHPAQAAGVGVDAAGLDQQGNAGFLRCSHQRGQIFQYLGFVVRKGAGHHVGHVGIPGHSH